jgi:hypothetical protein
MADTHDNRPGEEEDEEEEIDDSVWPKPHTIPCIGSHML